MFENEIYIAQLVAARIKGTITEPQQNELDAWVNASERNTLQYRKYIDEKELEEKVKDYFDVNSIAIFHKITEGIKDQQQVVAAPKVVRLWPRIAIAAAVVLMVLGAVWFINRNMTSGAKREIEYASDAAPGKEGATLTLANGEKIKLSTAINGELAKEAGVSVSKTADGQLVYVMDGTAESNNMNTLSTSNGETYRVKLPDGSNVWLNAASSITYRSSLNDNGTRRVKLVGEAYFEIAKDAQHPFVVESAGQEVEVLGTHFNINSYLDEPAISTTLYEGSVSITVAKAGSKQVLKPGEQALNTNGGLNVQEVNVDNVIDWQAGDFNLEGVAFTVLMRKIARWYDVEVVYEQSVLKDIKIGGWISRDKKLSQVLNFIESSGAVHFKIEDKKVIVTK
ncbi:FecR family protein [Pedobacter psychroterrae]|uniref:FecR family protein n=1 Tax=Pedobacter psychroterrae TaxID=2530453 RepID=A0A4R0NLJ8_9SPHI|nr:FecR family protein [Pedobacter psychroterrae]TCD01661.1 FecR family protein [Pedobacter psychroterrae]